MTSNRMSKEEVARRHAIYEREMAARKFEPWRRPENIPPGTPVKVRVLDKLYDGVMVRDVECGNLGPMLRIVSVKLGIGFEQWTVGCDKVIAERKD